MLASRKLLVGLLDGETEEATCTVGHVKSGERCN
jgi:hypothetical protein